MSEEELIEKAKEARLRAYAPYSEFKVGAAVQCLSGRVFTGANVENASYGLTVCAERAAIFNAVSSGEREFTSLALVADKSPPAKPCGACLQVISEFGPDCSIVCANLDGEITRHKTRALLPEAFKGSR
jgi:cytidine deaminase